MHNRVPRTKYDAIDGKPISLALGPLLHHRPEHLILAQHVGRTRPLLRNVGPIAALRPRSSRQIWQEFIVQLDKG